MLKENLHLLKATLQIYYTFKETVKVIFKHCLKVLEENIDLGNHTYLNTIKETVNVIFQHRL